MSRTLVMCLLDLVHVELDTVAWKGSESDVYGNVYKTRYVHRSIEEMGSRKTYCAASLALRRGIHMNKIPRRGADVAGVLENSGDCGSGIVHYSLFVQSLLH
jgi:hypothetical protein